MITRPARPLGGAWLLAVFLLLAATVAMAGGPSRTRDAWLPPGSVANDPGPSRVIFPPQQLTIRFNHKLHLAQGATCKTCHARALTSASVQDHLLPKGATCDACHRSDHADLNKVRPGDDLTGQCAFCHIGYKESDGNTVARMVMPRANMVFDHQKHLARNIQCGQCHGAVDQVEMATRDQLPRMRGCFKCHQMPDSAARGDAKSDCTTCHIAANPRNPAAPARNAAVRADNPSGRIRTVFASGVLEPPRWLHNAAHTPDFIERHKYVAGNDSQFCANCHQEDFCVGCHDGRVRPKSIHPSDYIAMHPIEARQATLRCTSCHNEQSFCLGCHQRVGVSMTGPLATRELGRFHPPKGIWSDAPRKPGHHSFEAERNLNACVSCHVERDCVVCHGGAGIGGGFNPHRNGFSGGCATQMRRNPRPCFVCHLPDDGVLAPCR
ncbi:cytochrome c3 family protein [Pendulispora albinea]|uniref:Cytochrome c3 family protein n=1 Tax=Pendulispora albinea TaxID=2741071 RepID=A0ABZ2M4E7_9BACT